MRVTFAVVSAFLILSLVLNVFLAVKAGKGTNNSELDKQTEAGEFNFLARRIFLEDPNDVIINFTGLRDSLREFAENYEGKIGIYFEYIPTGNHIGVNDREPFRRASLIKIPLVMRAYKLIEEGKLSKDQQMVIEAGQIDSGYGNLWKRGPGSRVTVEEAIKFALVDSDNTAYNVLKDKVNSVEGAEKGSENQIHSVYDYLDIPRSLEGKTLDISPRSFASMLKSLYFSAYLNYNSSNEMLEIMSDPSKKYAMLSAPIPDNIMVSRKFGVNREGPEDTLVTSDCGIVYFPKRPYILCVIVNEPPEKAANTILAVSKIVFEFVSNAN